MEIGILRPASMLPAIKCSICGAEILISSMGEHECGQASSAPPMTTGTITATSTPASRGEGFASSTQQEIPIPPEQHGRSAKIAHLSSTSHLHHASHLRPPRMPPPRIDAAAANKSYLEKDLSSGSSYGSLPTASPLAPLGSKNYNGLSPRSPMRSMTSPVPRRYRPPSPQMSSNLDCAFPPFPITRPTTSRSVSSPKQKRTDTPPEGHSSSIYGSSLHAEPESFCGPRSPAPAGGGHVAQRLNTIAPGPFDTRLRRPSNESGTSRPSPPSKQSSGAASVISKPEHTQENDPPISPIETPQQVYTPFAPEGRAFVAVAPPTATNREGRPVPQRPVRPEPLDGFLAMLKNEPPVPAVVLAEPVDGEHLPPPSVTSYDATRNDAQSMSHSVLNASDGPIEAFSSSVLPSDSQVNTMESKNTPASLTPISTIQAQAPQRTAHTPSGSASSTSSARSYGGNSFKFDLSPPVSATSSVSVLSATLEDGTREQDATLTSPAAQSKTKQSMLRLATGASTSSAFPSTPQNVSPASSSGTPVESPPETINQYPATLETVDTPVASPLYYQENLSSSPHDSTPLNAMPLAVNNARPQNNPQRPLDGPFKKPSTKRPGTSTRHTCRGCEETIVGKSVKAADGRLTGRYHKQCFVCKTCRSEFPTADFYVIDNNPYCERHYHQLNNSLCTGCDRGIEGPYLEAQQAQKKFHLDCFACVDCHKILSEDYFEISGAVYCEQHAFVALRRKEGLGPKRNMERRTTRLMMMSQ